MNGSDAGLKPAAPHVNVEDPGAAESLTAESQRIRLRTLREPPLSASLAGADRVAERNDHCNSGAVIGTSGPPIEDDRRTISPDGTGLTAGGRSWRAARPGGSNAERNLQLLWERCNRVKGAVI